MEMTFSVGDLSSLIQATISFLTLVVGVVTIIILVGYARDTKTLADCAVKQAEEATVPYLMIKAVDQANPFAVHVIAILNQRVLMIVNRGKGPAIGIELIASTAAKGEDPPSDQLPLGYSFRTESIGDLATDEEAPLPDWVRTSIANGKHVTLTYESLNGLPYRSIFVPSGALSGQHRFERLWHTENPRP
jgi:hypothetical protein